MKPFTRPKPLPHRLNRGFKNSTPDLSHPDERANQLADIATTGDDDNVKCAAADLFREFPPGP